MGKNICIKCNKPLNKSEIEKKASNCYRCNLKKRIVKIQTKDFLNEKFKEDWTAELFNKYIDYVKSWDFTDDTIVTHSRKAIRIFQMAEKEFSNPSDISEDWLLEKDNIKQMKGINKMLSNFLSINGHLKLKKKSKIMSEIERLIERVPNNFKHLLEIYVREQLAVRERQIMFNARTLLSLVTVRSHLESYTRLIRWLNEKQPQIDSWNTVQQEDVHEFLLELPLKNREITRKTLLILFKLGFKKKLITHIPILDMKSRELQLTIEPLSMDEQTKIAMLIKLNTYQKPLESLLVSLCFYHGLSSKKIREIQMKNVNIDEKAIYLEERTPIYLSEPELVILYEYLKKRSAVKSPFERKYLITPLKNKFYEDKPVSNKFILIKVKSLCGFPPKVLRITCFSTIAQKFGPQILVEGFGLSLSQASRYGKLEDYLIEEHIKDQREYVLNYTQSEQ